MDNFEKTVSGNTKLKFYFFTAIFLGMAFLSFLILKPFLISFILVVVFSVVFHPLYKKISEKLNKSPSFSSLLTVLLILLLILVPLSILGIKIFSEANHFYYSVSNNGSVWLGSIKDFSQGFIQKIFQTFHIQGSTDVFASDLSQYLKNGANWILGHLNIFFSSLFIFVFNTGIFIVMLYYFFKHSEEIRNFVIKLSPLSNVEDEKIFDRLGHAINSIVRGSITIALMQGILTGFGLAMFGVPNPALWGTLAALCALIPGVGTSIVLVPSVVYLALGSSIFNTIGLLIWGILAVGLIDNFLSPYLISRGSNIHPFLIFLSVLGGLILWGPIGFLLGPLSLSLLLTLFEFYSIETKSI